MSFPNFTERRKRQNGSNSRKRRRLLAKQTKLIESGWNKMANLPPSLSMGTPFGGPSNSAGAPANKDRNLASAEQLVLDLSNPELSENALLELSKVPPFNLTFVWVVFIFVCLV